MLLLLSLLLYLDHAICNRYVNSCNYYCSYYQQQMMAITVINYLL